MDENIKILSLEPLEDNAKSAKRVSQFWRPAARYYSVFKDSLYHEKDVEQLQAGCIYDKPLPCFGCGIGWFSFLLGFVCPILWYYAAFLYFRHYNRRDPRERAGLASSSIAALGFSVLLLVIAAFRVFSPANQ